MADWTETYRGAVPPWQCDVTEHFTVAYYFDRIEEAAANFTEERGIGDLSRGFFPRRIDVRFARELRAGASFHVETATLGVDDPGSALRIGHRVVDSATRETVTWFDDNWDLTAAPLNPEKRQVILAHLAAWDGPVVERRPEPTSAAGFIPTARGRVK